MEDRSIVGMETPAGLLQTNIVDEFLTKYQRDSQEWKELLEYTLIYLKDAVKDKAIPSLISGRVKEAEKVEKKLRGRLPFWKYSCEEHILNNLFDFVGLRISSYFPNDQKKILSLIEENFVCIATVYFRDDQEHYTLSESVSDEAGQKLVAIINERYEEVRPKEKKSEAPPSRNSKDTDENRRSKRTLDNYQRRFGGYTAEHRWVILRPEQRQAAGIYSLQPIEIQVRSVLMDSWIAINRDIEYDALTGILSTQERRILDSIKSLAQTGELLLEQLHHVHKQRLKADQITFKMPDDVTRVLVDYFDLDDPISNLSKDPFSDLLLSLLLNIEIDNPGKLKLHLRDNGIAPDCQEEFTKFSRSFPMQISIESFVLQHLLQIIRLDQIEHLWSISDQRRRPITVFMQRTLRWAGEIGARFHKDLAFPDKEEIPSTCGYEGLTLLFCILVWTLRGFTGSSTKKWGTRAMLTSDLLNDEGDISPFLRIALIQNLLFESSIIDDSSPQYSEQALVGWVVMVLAEVPEKWERGVELFTEKFESTIIRMDERHPMDEEKAKERERTGSEISKSMFHWMAKWSPVQAVLELAHMKSDLADSYPCSQEFWNCLSEHTMLKGFDELIEKDWEDFVAWQECRLSREWKPIRPLSSYQENVEKRSPYKGEITLFMLDCELLSRDEINWKMQCACLGPGGSADVVFLKNIQLGELPTEFYMQSYYSGHLKIESSGLYLVTLVYQGRFGRTVASPEAGALGPLWKVVSQEKDNYALVCDVIIYADPNNPPARLRLPNCKPGTQLEETFLHTDTLWAIEGCEFNYDEGEEGKYMSLGENLPFSVMVDGTCTNGKPNAGRFDSNYVLAFTLT